MTATTLLVVPRSMPMIFAICGSFEFAVKGALFARADGRAKVMPSALHRRRVANYNLSRVYVADAGRRVAVGLPIRQRSDVLTPRLTGWRPELNQDAAHQN